MEDGNGFGFGGMGEVVTGGTAREDEILEELFAVVGVVVKSAIRRMSFEWVDFGTFEWVRGSMTLPKEG